MTAADFVRHGIDKMTTQTHLYDRAHAVARPINWRHVRGCNEERNCQESDTKCQEMAAIIHTRESQAFRGAPHTHTGYDKLVSTTQDENEKKKGSRENPCCGHVKIRHTTAGTHILSVSYHNRCTSLSIPWS